MTDVSGHGKDAATVGAAAMVHAHMYGTMLKPFLTCFHVLSDH